MLGCELLLFFKAMHGQGIICSGSCPQVSPRWWGDCPALQQQRQGAVFYHAAGQGHLAPSLMLGNCEIAVLTDLLELLPLLIVEVVQVLIKLHTRHTSSTAGGPGRHAGQACARRLRDWHVLWGMHSTSTAPWRDSPGSADMAPKQAAPLLTTSLAICRACSRPVTEVPRPVLTPDSQAGQSVACCEVSQELPAQEGRSRMHLGSQLQPLILIHGSRV